MLLKTVADANKWVEQDSTTGSPSNPSFKNIQSNGVKFGRMKQEL